MFKLLHIAIGLFISALISIAIIFIINYFFKHKLLKYLPIGMALYFTICSFLNINNGNMGFKRMYYVVSLIIWLEILITMILTAIIIDFKKTDKKIT